MQVLPIVDLVLIMSGACGLLGSFHANVEEELATALLRKMHPLNYLVLGVGVQ